VLRRTELQRSQQASSEILYVLTSDMEDMVADPSGGSPLAVAKPTPSPSAHVHAQKTCAPRGGALA